MEFAISASLLFVLFFACIDFSRANLIYHAANNAAFEGARRGVVPGVQRTDIEQRAHQIMARALVRNVSVNVTPQTITELTPEITVTVSVPMADNQWFNSLFFRDRMISQSSTIRREDY